MAKNSKLTTVKYNVKACTNDITRSIHKKKQYTRKT